MDTPRSLTAVVHTGWAPLEALRQQWDQLLASCSKGVLGPDETCSFTWADALVQTHLKNAQLRTLVVRSGTEPVAILPAYLAGGGGLVRPRVLKLITQAHSGRAGLLTLGNDPALVDFLLERLVRDVQGWDVFELGVVQGSPSHVMVLRAAQQLGLHLRVIDKATSPYVELAETWEAVVAALPKKMRWTIKKSEKDLQEKGQLGYEHVTELHQVPALIEAIYAVERKSWKEESGTSITAHSEQQGFYEALVKLAAERGVLSAHVLRLNGEPLAYILGIAGRDGVFLDLKESYDAAFREHSPGHVLKRYAIDALLARGIRTYDFMGGCEPYKMKWTDKTYFRLTLAISNRTLGGAVAHYRAVIRGKLKPASRPQS